MFLPAGLLLLAAGCAADQRSEVVVAPGAEANPPVVDPLLQPGEAVDFSRPDAASNVLTVDAAGTYTWQSGVIGDEYREPFRGVAIEYNVQYPTGAANVEVMSHRYVETSAGTVMELEVAVADIREPPVDIEIAVAGGPVDYEESPSD